MKDKVKNLSYDEVKEVYPLITQDLFKNKDMDTFAEITQVMVFKSLKKFTLNNQIFEYSFRKNHLGGYRWYVLCPKCKATCLKLYLPNKFKDREQLYLCKDCHDLKNSSSLLGATNRYKKVVRPLKRLEAIKTALLKRNIQAGTAKDLLLEYEMIERELNASPEYRLWKFQRDHSPLMANRLL